MSVQGRPINILSYDAQRDVWRFDSTALYSVLDDERTKHLPTCVISLAGKKRLGKSMLLNYCLRYLCPESSTSNWMGHANAPLQGFESSAGSSTVTQGIWIWSEVFVLDNECGEKISVVLLDCEGLYGDGRDTNVTSRIFGIACALSSHLVFNVHESLSTEDLLNLNLFVSLGRFGMKYDRTASHDNTNDCNANDVSRLASPRKHKTFQHLTFLVRSWRFADEHDFGHSPQYLHRHVTSIFSTDCESLKRTKQALISSFEQLDCYLMPDPGTVAIYSKSFRGEHSHFTTPFRDSLRAFIEDLFSPSKLTIKEIAGERISCANLCQIFENMERKADLFPRVPCLRTAAVLAFEAIIVENVVNEYADDMRAKLYGTQRVDEKWLSEVHNCVKKRLMEKFSEMDKIVTEQEEANLERRLNKLLDGKFSVLLGDYERFISQTRREWLDTGVQAAAISAASLAVTIVQGNVIGDITLFGMSIFGTVGLSAFSLGSFVSLINLWRWIDSLEAMSIIQRLRDTFSDNAF